MLWSGDARNGNPLFDNGSSISEPEFLSFCKDFKFASPALTQAKQIALFANIQAEGEDGATAEDSECDFDEFFEAICALCCYIYPDNYIPLADRLNYFFIKNLYTVAIDELKFKGLGAILQKCGITLKIEPPIVI